MHRSIIIYKQKTVQNSWVLMCEVNRGWILFFFFSLDEALCIINPVSQTRLKASPRLKCMYELSQLKISCSDISYVPGRWSNGCPLLQVCVQCVCVCSLLTAVCVHLDGLNAEDQFRVWVTILDNTSLIILLLFFLKHVSVIILSQDAQL